MQGFNPTAAGRHGVKTLAVLSRKGGTGKTTIALHLAAQAQSLGHRTMIADADSQHSAIDWFSARLGNGPLVVPARPGPLFTVREAAIRSGVDLTVIDTRPSADGDCIEAARLADLCLIVVRPSAFDIRAVRDTAEMLARQGRQGWFVINQAPARRSGKEVSAVRRAVESLESYGFPVAPIGLRARSVYQTAVAQGLSAGELDPGSTGAREIAALWSAVAAALWPKTEGASIVRFPKASALHGWPAARAGDQPATLG
jgi:chromosome partitioning protein